MKEQKIVAVDSEYEANCSIKKLRKDGWLVMQITMARSNYAEVLYMLFERETEENITIND